MHILKRNLSITTALGLSLGLLGPSHAFAQIETIVITARKKEENLQKTPIAVTAFTQETLERRQLFTVNEIAQYVPNLQYSNGAAATSSASSFSIRGIGQVDFITTTDPGVGTYLDGVYLARTTGAALELADIERIEVLRGPQGTLFGRNTIGGAVSLVTRKPSGEFGLRGNVTGGNNARAQGRFILDVPIADDVLSGKFTFLGKTSDGWGEDLEPEGGSGNLGADDDIAGKIQLRWTPAETAEFNLSTEYWRRRGTGLPTGRVFFDETSPAAPGFDDGGRNSVIGVDGDVSRDDLNLITLDASVQDHIDVFGASLISDFDLGSVKLKLITAYREQDQASGQDIDGGNTPILNQFITADQWQFSQEIQLTGGGFDERLDWLVGGYFFTEDGEFITDAQLAGAQLDIDTRNETTSFAGFAQATFALTDSLSLTGGARYTTEKKEIDIDTVLGGAALVTDGVDDERFSAFTPKASLEYQATDTTLLYFSYSQGFRSGGYNGRAFSPGDLTPFDEERVTSYEAGVKLDLAENRLRVNLAGFFANYRDIQLTATATDDDGNFIIVTDNAGRIDLYGFEVEFQAQPNDQLFLFGAVGFTNTDGLEPQEGFDLESAGIGDTLPLASKWTASFGAEYTVPISSDYDAVIGADYAYRSGYFPLVNNSPLARQDEYGLFNARMELRPASGAWSFTLWGKNLTNEVYRTFGQDSTINGLPPVVAYFAPTREYGATISFDFN